MSELDLQYNILLYLEEKIKKSNDKRWRIHNCYYLKISKKYPDIIIFQNENPIMCVEIKYYGFNNPKENKIFKDLNKLKIYFNDYPTLKFGFSFNIFSQKEEQFFNFRRTCKNKIKDSRIKIINLNLENFFRDFDYIKLHYNKFTDLLTTILTKRSKR